MNGWVGKGGGEGGWVGGWYAYLGQVVSGEMVGFGGPLLLHDVLLKRKDLNHRLKVAECCGVGWVGGWMGGWIGG